MQGELEELPVAPGNSLIRTLGDDTASARAGGRVVRGRSDQDAYCAHSCDQVIACVWSAANHTALWRIRVNNFVKHRNLRRKAHPSSVVNSNLGAAVVHVDQRRLNRIGKVLGSLISVVI